MEEKRLLQSIPDDELLRRLAELMGHSRRAEADIVAHIAEVEERRLYAREAFPSMFTYCMIVLHFSEAEAYLRIAAARASRKHPMLLTMLADGRLHLTAIDKLAPHLTCENRERLLERATQVQASDPGADRRDRAMSRRPGSDSQASRAEGALDGCPSRRPDRRRGSDA